MDTGILFLSGQLQARETNLLNINRLDRMIGAKTAEDAFRVMVELQYSEYFDENTKPQSFAKIIEKGLLETKNMIVEATKNHKALQFLWRRFDLNNLKRAYKIKFFEKKDFIENFTEENGFDFLGNLTKEDLENIVFKNKKSGDLPEEFTSVCFNVDNILDENEDDQNSSLESRFRNLEFALDNAHFNYLYKVAKKQKDHFLKELFKFIVDSVNFRTLARFVLIFEKKLQNKAWINHGNFLNSETKDIQTFEDLEIWAKKTHFNSVLDKIKKDDSAEEKIIKIEKGIDKLYREIVENSVMGEIASIQIPIRYFEKRLQNARLLKFIMFAKFHGLSPDNIYKSLEHF